MQVWKLKPLFQELTGLQNLNPSFYLFLFISRLNELGIKAKSPAEFIEKAKSIVTDHHQLERKKSTLELEIRRLEQDRDTIIGKGGKRLVTMCALTRVSHVIFDAC